jgi:WD40 repeat protein
MSFLVLFVGGQDKNIYIWDVVEGKPVRVISPPNPVHTVNAVCFGNHWRLQRDGSQLNSFGGGNVDSLSDYGFWCLLNGEMQFFTIA